MSIWCSRREVGFDEWETEDEDEPRPRGGQVRTYVDGWSNHYPTTDDLAEQEAEINLAHVAPWCTPGWHDRELEIADGTVGPWLRLGIAGPDTQIVRGDVKVSTDYDMRAMVVLDEAAVRQLIADLQEWVDTPKVHPT